MNVKLNQTKKNNVSKSGELRMKFFDVSREEKGSFYYFNYQRNTCFKVTKIEFQTRGGKVYTRRACRIKAEGGTDAEMRDAVNALFVEFSAESLTDFITGISTVVDAVSLIGKTTNFVGQEADNIKSFLIGSCSLFIKFLLFKKDDNFVLNVVSLCVEFYRTFCLASSLRRAWNGEILETAILAAASFFLPSKLTDILRKMSLLTSAKLFDDIGGFFTLFNYLVDFLSKVTEFLPFQVPESIGSFFSKIFCVRHHLLLREMTFVTDKWKKDKKIIIDTNFQREVLELNKKKESNLDIMEWSRRSNGVKVTIGEFDKLIKSLLAYQRSNRVEPSCFIFEGPPRTMKSVIMAKLVTSLSKSTYTHVCKSAMDGKDFYDTYNSEDVFLMDDVGQQGVSQWRNIINMVSPIKLPLDCAAAELKDTKYFSSDLVLLTTNNFHRLDQGLTKADCIESIGALWRRGYVFDFAQVATVGGEMTGFIQFKHFDVKLGWLADFDLAQRERFSLQDLCLPTRMACDQGHKLILAWMLVIVENTLEMKKLQFESNDLTAAELVDIRLLSKQFTRGGGLVGESLWNKAKEVMLDGITLSQDVAEWVMDNIILVITDFVSSCDPIAMVKRTCTQISQSSITELLRSTMAFFFEYATSIFLVFVGSKYLLDKVGSKSSTLIKSAPQKVIDVFVKESEAPRELHPSIKSLRNHIFDIQVISESSSMTCVGLLSGKQLVTVGHASLEEKAFLIVYRSLELNSRIVDNVSISRIFFDKETDIAVWNLPVNFPSPFKNIAHLFRVTPNVGMNYLVNPLGVINVDKIRAKGVDIPTPYEITSKGEKVTNLLNRDDIFYGVRYPGMCGSVITTEEGVIVAIHVAGSEQLGIGAAIRLPAHVLNSISTALSTGASLNVELSPNCKPNFSGMKLNSTVSVYTPKHTNIVPSRLHNVFPISRFPANLSANGPHTVKDVAAKSFAPVVSVSQEELDFGKKVVASMLPVSWGDMSMDEVINGTDFLAGINKKSSNGYNCPGDKLDCIDYVNGCLHPEFAQSYSDFLKLVDEDKYNVEDVVWFETLKDELRVPNKLPRSFRVSRLHMQILTKQSFGRMVEHIVKYRKANQIMIGVNPFQEWREIYNTFSPHKFWAGDIKSWDGSMLPQVQHSIFEVFQDKYKGDQKHLNCITGFLNYCLVAVNDDLYLTSHSMPSGSFLTAIFNSLVNRFYTAMWFYRECKKNKVVPTVSLFEKVVVDFVYGDDKLNAIRGDYPFLNAISMRDFFVSIGMDFTDSKKGVIDKPYQRIEDITFLKRSFVFHKDLLDIVGPLDLDTVYSSLSWFDKKKEEEDVLRDKLHAFQREMFLHIDIYAATMLELAEFCRERGVGCVILPKDYLVQLYKSNDYCSDVDLYGIKIVT